jgi:hypothetical protein
VCGGQTSAATNEVKAPPLPLIRPPAIGNHIVAGTLNGLSHNAVPDVQRRARTNKNSSDRGENDRPSLPWPGPIALILVAPAAKRQALWVQP